MENEDKLLWNLLLKHKNHNIKIVTHGDRKNPYSVCLECEDCRCIILDAGVETITTRWDFENCFKEKENNLVKHTMRSAFKRWLVLHNEEWRFNAGHIRIPHWFRHYIRHDTEWTYQINNENEELYCNKCELDNNVRRRYKGHYVIWISDEKLLKLQRPEWIK